MYNLNIVFTSVNFGKSSGFKNTLNLRKGTTIRPNKKTTTLK